MSQLILIIMALYYNLFLKKFDCTVFVPKTFKIFDNFGRNSGPVTLSRVTIDKVSTVLVMFRPVWCTAREACRAAGPTDARRKDQAAGPRWPAVSPVPPLKSTPRRDIVHTPPLFTGCPSYEQKHVCIHFIFSLRQQLFNLTIAN